MCFEWEKIGRNKRGIREEWEKIIKKWEGMRRVIEEVKYFIFGLFWVGGDRTRNKVGGEEEEKKSWEKNWEKEKKSEKVENFVEE